ncbi:MAG: PRC-barrel domain-containing protein, partial [Methylobacteriaceae bacterium]|nr:PRC-barrel domain-containing protein [Methylobacteriaceae bacterium]
MRAKVYDGTRPDLGADGDRSPLIASDRVEGTPVRRGGGERIGTIERLMIEKRSGRVACAVMSFGGVLGLGAEHRILPWHVLTYSPELDAYAVSLTDEELGRAPLRG